MNLCDAKQKAFAQRVYLDLKICRQWSKLHVHFDEVHRRIFFVGAPSIDQPLTFILPMSCDAQLTVDDLFELKSKLAAALSNHTGDNIQNVLMAIVANDFTIGYFNFTSGLPTPAPLETTEEQAVYTVDNEFTGKSKADTSTDEWTAIDATTIWD